MYFCGSEHGKPNYMIERNKLHQDWETWVSGRGKRQPHSMASSFQCRSRCEREQSSKRKTTSLGCFQICRQHRCRKVWKWRRDGARALQFPRRLTDVFYVSMALRQIVAREIFQKYYINYLTGFVNVSTCSFGKLIKRVVGIPWHVFLPRKWDSIGCVW